MLLERFEDKGLAHYSYTLGCESAGIVAIVDPRRDVDVYREFAHHRGLRITHVLETHIHADFASGARELAEAPARKCGCRVQCGRALRSRVPASPDARREALTLGNVRIEARHTPGHAPEHLAFLGFELARAPTTPAVMLSGDFLFVGSLGRPDLIGEHAKVALANALYNSVTRVLPPLPDGLEIHPAHGAGSMCGSGRHERPADVDARLRARRQSVTCAPARSRRFRRRDSRPRAAVSAVLQADEAAQRAWPGDIGSSTWPEAARRTRIPCARRQRIRRRRRARPVVVRRRPHPGVPLASALRAASLRGRLGGAIEDADLHRGPSRLMPKRRDAGQPYGVR